MSLREDMWKYEQITGESAEHVPIIKLGAFLDGYEMAIKALEQARPKGKWKRISPAGIYECTNCNQMIMTSDIDCYKYCHGCGTRMEVNADDNT